MFSESDKRRAIEETIKEQLRKSGLSHLRHKVNFKSGDDFEIEVDGSEDEVTRVSQALGGAQPKRKSSALEIGRLDPSISIETTPRVSTGPKIAVKRTIRTARPTGT